MKKFILFAILLLSFSANALELMSLKAFLKSELSKSAKMGKESFELDSSQKSHLSSLAPDSTDSKFTFYFGRDAEGKLVKACVSVPQKGKEGPLKIGVCFDEVGLVQSVQVLSTEEERGRKIEEVDFLKQFQGKKVSSAFQVGSDIDAVSGATWSSKAVAEAVRKSSFAYKTFVKGKK